jgi:hypothetical protein
MRALSARLTRYVAPATLLGCHEGQNLAVHRTADALGGSGPAGFGPAQSVTITALNVAEGFNASKGTGRVYRRWVKTGLTSTEALTKIEKFIQYASTESQRINGDPLVDTVEHAGKVEIRRKL